MNDVTESPYEQKPPSSKGLVTTIAVAIVVALIVLVTVILPAEYGVDPTGIGKLTGLTALNDESDPTRTVEIVDVLGGNDALQEVEVPDFGEPVPLPNPSVYQEKVGAVETYTTTIVLQPSDETEVKTVLQEAQVVTYEWSSDQGTLYVDFHGHDPAMGNDFWVRYREGVEVSQGAGSLVAPFKGEHGWYFVNYNEFPVEITLQISGYYDEVIDYGIWNRY